VRWGVTNEIVMAWLLTFPVCGALGFVFGFILKPLFA
jgi:PiT family inorganic phosphate transporter